MKRFFAFCICFILLTGVLPVSALSNGDVIGNIYNTDILAFVDDAPIRSYALNGKTAILVEDLARFGFVVGYNDAARTLYAYIKPNTFPHQPEEGIERGTVGGIAGNIYHSDIQTYINGVLVPSFALNGLTAVAIEDIATDSTTDNISKTCMTYTWDGENRTIRLNPVYDNTAKVARAGNFYIENDRVLFSEDGRKSKRIFANIPDNAYALPLLYENEVVAYAYQTFITVPDQNNSDTHQMRTDKRYIINWDYERFLALTQNRQNTEFSYETLLEREKAKLANPEIFDFETFTLLYDSQNILSISKEVPCFTDFSEMIATDGMADCVTQYTKPQFTIKNAQKREDYGIFFIESDNGLLMLRAENGYGFLSRFMPRESDIGLVYTLKSTHTAYAQSGTVTVNGKATSITEILSYGMWRYLPLQALSTQASADGLSVSVTADEINDFSCTTTEEPRHVAVYSLSDDGYHPEFWLNGEKTPLVVRITAGHFENTSIYEMDLPLIYYNGKIYAPIDTL